MSNTFSFPVPVRDSGTRLYSLIVLETDRRLAPGDMRDFSLSRCLTSGEPMDPAEDSYVTRSLIWAARILTRTGAFSSKSSNLVYL